MILSGILPICDTNLLIAKMIIYKLFNQTSKRQRWPDVAFIGKSK
jgi:hypothetical protein